MKIRNKETGLVSEIPRLTWEQLATVKGEQEKFEIISDSDVSDKKMQKKLDEHLKNING